MKIPSFTSSEIEILNGLVQRASNARVLISGAHDFPDQHIKSDLKQAWSQIEPIKDAAAMSVNLIARKNPDDMQKIESKLTQEYGVRDITYMTQTANSFLFLATDQDDRKYAVRFSLAGKFIGDNDRTHAPHMTQNMCPPISIGGMGQAQIIPYLHMLDHTKEERDVFTKYIKTLYADTCFKLRSTDEIGVCEQGTIRYVDPVAMTEIDDFATYSEAQKTEAERAALKVIYQRMKDWGVPEELNPLTVEQDTGHILYKQFARYSNRFNQPDVPEATL